MKRILLAVLAILILAGGALWLVWPAGPEATAVANPLTALPDQETSAQSVLVLDRDSGQPLYASNAEARIYPASTTKMMTALCAVEKVRDLDRADITVRQELLDLLKDTNSSLAGLVDGETLSMRQLLYCMMLPSGNDAALVVADAVSGSVEAFARLMNRQAEKLGCTDTHFVNPHGLAGEEHYTTAWDLARIAEAYMRQPVLAEIAGTLEYTFTSDLRGEVTVRNTNQLLNPNSSLYEPAARGIKTGTLSLGDSFVSAGEQDGLRILCVVAAVPAKNANGVLISPNPALAEGRKFLSWACGQFAKVTLYDGAADIPLAIDGTDRYAMTKIEGPVTAVIPKAQAEQLTPVVSLTRPLKAPLFAGMTVGTVTWWCGDTPVFEGVPLVLTEGIHVLPVWVWLVLAAVFVAAGTLLAVQLRRRRTPVPAQAGDIEWVKEEPPEDPDWYGSQE